MCGRPCEPSKLDRKPSDVSYINMVLHKSVVYGQNEPTVHSRSSLLKSCSMHRKRIKESRSETKLNVMVEPGDMIGWVINRPSGVSFTSIRDGR